MEEVSEMSVVDTHKWLVKLKNAYENTENLNMASVQCEILCKPLVDVFQTSCDDIYNELIQNGLFKPHEVEALEWQEQRGIWDETKAAYERLQKLWNGPEVAIYIFPITKEEAISHKNGIAYANALFLFISEKIEKEEICALVAHEYHHICRIAYLGKNFNQMTLKDSLLIEGMAECAVEELYGEKWLGPWLKWYSKKELSTIWKDHFLPSLSVEGLHNHFPFLYGGQLPKSIGYCIGYEIVCSFKKNFPFRDPLTTPSEEILAGSDFTTL